MIKRVFMNRGVPALVLFALLITTVVLSFSDSRWRRQIRHISFDTYNRIKPRQASGRVIIVDIDEDSLRAVGQMPWPRTVMAELVMRLKEMGAAVIAFDIVFAEPDRLSPPVLSRVLPDPSAARALAALPDHDTVFAESIRQAGNVVTGFSFTHAATDNSPRQKGVFRGRQVEDFIPRLTGASANIRAISRDAAGNGSFFVSADTDGLIRRVPMLVAHQKQDAAFSSIYPALSLEAVRVLDGASGGQIRMADPAYAMMDKDRFGIERIVLGERARAIPTNPRGEFLVYFAASDPAWYVPAHSILDGTVSADTVRDKIVLVGTSAVGLKDIRSTPLNNFVPGVEVHLNIIDQILQGQFLSRSVEAEGAEALIVLCAGALILLLTPFAGTVMLALVVGLIMSALAYAGFFLFESYGILIDVTYPALAVLVIFFFAALVTYARVAREKRQVREAFGQYISPDFMAELTKNPDKLSLGGEIREITIVFIDMRNFTAIAEALAPQDLIKLMNDFLTPMSELIMQNRGTIDKYMGDAIMAFWNAPLDDPQHARNACRAALGMKEALAPINEAMQEKAAQTGTPPVLLSAGVGINTGPCAVGNMGSRQRFDYSALGDAVNLCSRLEGQTKVYGTPILIGPETQRQVPDFAALEVDLIRVKGRSEPVHIFALLGDETKAETAQFKAWKETHDQMIKAYRARDFDNAARLAQDCMALEKVRMQAVYELYHTRCTEMMKNPPPADWNGVYKARNK